MWLCVYASALGGQKRESAPLDLELQMIVTTTRRRGPDMGPLQEQSVLTTTEMFPQPLGW